MNRPSPQEAIEDDIVLLAGSLHLQFVIYTVELCAVTPCVNSSVTRCVGDVSDAIVPLIQYTRGGVGVHFDPIGITDRFSDMSLASLRACCRDEGITVGKIDKTVHLRGRLRLHGGFSPLSLLAIDPVEIAPVIIDAPDSHETLQRSPSCCPWPLDDMQPSSPIASQAVVDGKIHDTPDTDPCQRVPASALCPPNVPEVYVQSSQCPDSSPGSSSSLHAPSHFGLLVHDLVAQCRVRLAVEIVNQVTAESNGLLDAIVYVLTEGLHAASLRNRPTVPRVSKTLEYDGGHLDHSLLIRAASHLELGLVFYMIDLETRQVSLEHVGDTMKGYVVFVGYKLQAQLVAVNASRLPSELAGSISQLGRRFKALGGTVPRNVNLCWLRGKLRALLFPISSLACTADPAPIVSSPSGATRSELIIVQWNLCSASAKKSSLAEIARQFRPHVIILGETHLSPKDAFSLSGYVVASRVDRLGAKGGGHMILVKNTLTHEPLVHVSHGSHSGLQMSSIGVMFDGHLVRIAGGYCAPITSAYCPPVDLVVAELEQYVQEVDIIAGDLNVHWNEFSDSLPDDARSMKFLELMEVCDWQLHEFPGPTRVAGGSVSSPDQLLTTPEYACSVDTSLVATPSDHMALVHTFGGIISSPQNRPKARWCMRNADWTAFAKCVDELLAPFSRDVLSMSASDHAWLIQQVLLRSGRKIVPRGPRGGGSSRKPPWSNADVTSAHRRLSHAHAQCVAHSDCDSAVTELRSARAQYSTALASSKRASWERLCEQLESKGSGAVRSPDRLMKKMEGKLAPEPAVAITDPSTGRYVHSDYHRAALLHRHFLSASTPTSEERRAARVAVTHLRKQLSTTACSYDWASFPLLVVREISDALQLGRLGHAPGHDDIPHEFLLHGGQRLSVHLALLCNQIVLSGSVPDTWTRAIWIPLRKPGKSASEVNGYRPVSLLPSLYKLLERLVLVRIQVELPPVSAEQFGYKAGMSAATAYAALVHHLHAGVTGKSASRLSKPSNRFGVLTLDIRGAFDRVRPQVLLSKLCSQGLSAPWARLIWHMLRQRRTCVRMNGVCSSWKKVEYGLPQGSVLAPFLFSKYIESHVSNLASLPDTHCMCFADDITIFVNGRSVEEVERKLQHAFHVAQEMDLALGLPFSIDKCMAHIFSPHPHESKRSLAINSSLASDEFVLVMDSDDIGLLLPSMKLAGRHHLLDTVSHPVDGLPGGLWHLVRANDLAHFTESTLRDLAREGPVSLCFCRTLGTSQVLHLLGGKLDNSLSVASEVSCLRKKCLPALQLVRRLSGATWGPSVHLLRRLCLAFVRSRLALHLPAVYFLASSSKRAQLDRIDHLMCRVILSAPHGSNSSALLLEAAILPVGQFASLQACRHLVTFTKHPHVPLLASALRVMPNAFAQLGEGWLAAARSLWTRVFGLVSPDVVDLRASRPYRGNISIDRVNLADSCRSAKNVRLQSFHAELALHDSDDTALLVSDGSFDVSSSRGGGAYLLRIGDQWCEEHSLGPMMFSSFDAELYGFFLGLRGIQRYSQQYGVLPCSRLLWCCDNLSCIHAVTRAMSTIMIYNNKIEKNKAIKIYIWHLLIFFLLFNLLPAALAQQRLQELHPSSVQQLHLQDLPSCHPAHQHLLHLGNSNLPHLPSVYQHTPRPLHRSAFHLHSRLNQCQPLLLLLLPLLPLLLPLFWLVDWQAMRSARKAVQVTWKAELQSASHDGGHDELEDELEEDVD